MVDANRNSARIVRSSMQGLAALALCIALAGCGATFASLPGIGQPDVGPPRPDVAPEFPHVFRTPPQADRKPSEAEDKKLEADLATARTGAAAKQRRAIEGGPR
jgi:hypothetical protein